MKKSIFITVILFLSIISFGQSADLQMIQAAYDGDEATVIRLLDAGANPNATDANGYSALIYASAYGYQGIMKKLIEKKASVTKMYNGVHPIVAAVNNDNTTSIQMLIDAGAYVNCKDAEGYTPLMFAAQEGYVKSVQYLLKKGARIDAENNLGHTALSIAVQNDHTDVVKVLLKYHPKKSGYSHYAHSPINTAIYLRKDDSKKILKDYGMKSKKGAPSFEYVSLGLGFEVSPYDYLVNYKAGLHETMYNFVINLCYSQKPKKATVDMLSSSTIYSATNNIYLSLNKNFKLFSIKKLDLGITIGGFGSSYYGMNSSNNPKAQFLYGLNTGLYFKYSIFTLGLNYNRVLNNDSYFYSHRVTGSIMMKFHSFKKSKTKYTYSDKTLMMI